MSLGQTRHEQRLLQNACSKILNYQFQKLFDDLQRTPPSLVISNRHTVISVSQNPAWNATSYEWFSSGPYSLHQYWPPKVTPMFVETPSVRHDMLVTNIMAMRLISHHISLTSDKVRAFRNPVYGKPALDISSVDSTPNTKRERVKMILKFSVYVRYVGNLIKVQGFI